MSQYPSGTWHPMSQEDAFARSHTLVVGTTPTVTASTWRTMLAQAPDVTGVETVQPGC